MKKHWRRMLALLLAILFMLSLAACNQSEESESQTEKGEELQLGSWKGVDFKGKTLRVEVSANQDFEVTFRPADVYTKGPDSVSEDAVLKNVYDRNRRISTVLGLDIEYSTTDLAYDEVLDDVKRKVQLNTGDAPDIYNNDAFGISRAMFSDLFVNVVAPKDASGAALESYFDFDQPYWYRDYMEGMTFHKDKQYVLTGDYFIDIIRMAWVYYVNLDYIDEMLEPTGFDRAYLYELVESRDFTVDEMLLWSELAFRDEGDVKDEEDAGDKLGMMVNHVGAYVFHSSSGQSMVGLGEDGMPTMITDTSAVYQFSRKIKELYQAVGVYFESDVINSTVLFMKGNVLFSMSVLGEMESDEMRNLQFVKGLVPYPIYDPLYQTEYNTTVHDQAEVGVILNTTSRFTEASAFMQYANELSVSTLHEYYENSLKLKYNDDPDTKSMIDIVHGTICSPFILTLQNAVMDTYPPAGASKGYGMYLALAQDASDNFNSLYASIQGAWQGSFTQAYEAFKDCR